MFGCNRICPRQDERKIWLLHLYNVIFNKPVSASKFSICNKNYKVECFYNVYNWIIAMKDRHCNKNYSTRSNDVYNRTIAMKDTNLWIRMSTNRRECRRSWLGDERREALRSWKWRRKSSETFGSVGIDHRDVRCQSRIFVRWLDPPVKGKWLWLAGKLIP